MYIPSFAVFWATYKRTLIGLAVVCLIVLIGLLADWDAALIAAVAALVGIVTQAFAGMLGLIALVPWIGPLIAKALAIPVVWLINGAGYFFSAFLAGRGHGKSVVNSRILTVVLIVGIIIGFILGKIIG